jgi:hypothetical protein
MPHNQATTGLRTALSRAWHLADQWERDGSERTRRGALRCGQCGRSKLPDQPGSPLSVLPSCAVLCCGPGCRGFESPRSPQRNSRSAGPSAVAGGPFGVLFCPHDRDRAAGRLREIPGPRTGSAGWAPPYRRPILSSEASDSASGMGAAMLGLVISEAVVRTLEFSQMTQALAGARGQALIRACQVDARGREETS